MAQAGGDPAPCMGPVSCGGLVGLIMPETASWANLDLFKTTAWTADPQCIPTLCWLAVPEPGERRRLQRLGVPQPAHDAVGLCRDHFVSASPPPLLPTQP